jgi:hypothetical protein
VGPEDVTGGITVGGDDIPNVVITVAAPRNLPHVRGKITGATDAASATVEMTGPIVGKLSSAVQKDGSFDFGAVTPGSYTLTIPKVPKLPPTLVVVQQSDVQVALAAPR